MLAAPVLHGVGAIVWRWLELDGSDQASRPPSVLAPVTPRGVTAKTAADVRGVEVSFKLGNGSRGRLRGSIADLKSSKP